MSTTLARARAGVYVPRGGGGGGYAAAVMADTPLVYWRLGDASGTSAVDSSGNARHGTYSGGPTLGVSGLVTDPTNKAVSFDGADDRVTLSPFSSAPAAFTAEAWVKPSTSTLSGTILARWVDSPNRLFWLRLQGGTPTFSVWPSGDSSTDLSAAGGALAANTTHHVVGTYAGGTMRIYVDGVEKGNVAGVAAPSSAAVALTAGGVSATSNNFNGVLDEEAFYGAALSAARIAAHYAAGI